MSRDRTVGETFYIAFTTRAFATGIPTVLAGTPVISAYEDAGLTQITAGITLSVDHDSVVGFNMITMVATGANGYEAGKDYHLVITTGTVGGVSVVGEVVGHFSLGLSAAFTRLGAPAGASIAADLLTIDNFVDELESRLTAARAGYLDELAAANLPSDIDTLIVRLTAVRAGYLDNLSAGAVALEATLTAMKGATYTEATDSLEAIRNRGDAAWTTGGGGSITDILNVCPLIPQSIDLANTATVRLGLMLYNALDDLPSTAEITPGTISIERKAIGGTSWSVVVTDAACSEIAGLIYYDEVFDSGTGYAEGDTIRITFKSQKITVAANDYEVVGTTGRMFYTEIRQTMRGTDSAAVASVCTEARLAELDAANLPATTDGIQTDLSNSTDGLGALKMLIDALNDISVSDILTTQMTEAYAADGIAPTVAQALFAILQQAGEFAIAGTTITVKKLDGSTTAMIFTLDDGTNPTSRTRAT